MKPTTHIAIEKITAGNSTAASDVVTTEEPLEIQLVTSTATGTMKKSVAVTMRTPGDDEALAAGFLFTEAILRCRQEIKEIQGHATDPNIIIISLQEGIRPSLKKTEKNFYTSSSCGVCGKASIEAIRTETIFTCSEKKPGISKEMLFTLPGKLKQKQSLFESTGGIHAAALFNSAGDLLSLAEDVGRHNALDKLIGKYFLAEKLPINEQVLVLSGRASFELVQKAAMAGIGVIAAMGAPSSLAVELAEEHGMTLVGFLKADGFNIYSGKERIS